MQDREDLEGNMRTVTDEEWRANHDRFAQTVDWPVEELAYIWAPEQPATDVEQS